MYIFWSRGVLNIVYMLESKRTKSYLCFFIILILLQILIQLIYFYLSHPAVCFVITISVLTTKLNGGGGGGEE
jgi:hypothetical protein